MLPRVRRLTRREEIAAVARARRVGAPLVVVHGKPAESAHCSRFAFAVGKSVGNSVVRHAVTRRIRHVVAADIAAWDELGMDILVRALPGSATASSALLARDLRRCREKLERVSS